MDDPPPRTSTPSSPTSQGHLRSLSPASHVSNRDRRAGTPTLHGPLMSAMSDLLPSLKHTGDDDRAPERETPALFRPIERGRDCQLSPLPALTFAPLDGSDWPHSPMPPDVVRDLPLDEAQIQFIASASADELLQCVNRAYAALLHKNLMLEQENLQLQAKIRTMRWVVSQSALRSSGQDDVGECCVSPAPGSASRPPSRTVLFADSRRSRPASPALHDDIYLGYGGDEVDLWALNGQCDFEDGDDEGDLNEGVLWDFNDKYNLEDGDHEDDLDNGGDEDNLEDGDDEDDLEDGDDEDEDDGRRTDTNTPELFMTKQAWLDSNNTVSDPDSHPSEKGGPRAARGVDVARGLVDDRNGHAIGGYKAGELRSYLESIWQAWLDMGVVPLECNGGRG